MLKAEYIVKAASVDRHSGEVRRHLTKGTICRVQQGSIAERLGIAPGDALLAVNGKSVRDIIDLSFALADEYVELLVARQGGGEELFAVEKEYDQDLGLEFTAAVFDRIRPCANKCVFCFVDQMPPGMRESLYVKDDDYRLSFLYGNFITLTNLGPRDLAHIRRLHLSPLYVSVHATDGAVRAALLGNPRAADILDRLRGLTASGIDLHTQVVLCPGLNDGPVLERTIADLYALAPGVLSLAVVPVGLTRHREKCQPLRGFTPDEAETVIAAVAAWQRRCRAATGSSFVYLADEFYLACGQPIPEYDHYDGFPQLENGVGIVRSFLAEWAETAAPAAGYKAPLSIDVVCGRSAAAILAPRLAGLSLPNLAVRLIAAENAFFGPDVTVTGLLTGGDIAAALKKETGPRDGVILPGVALRKGENIFLDGLTPEDIARTIGTPVRVAHFAADLKGLLAAWR
jgi:putative radical SAM enzyme (TIGR03279 family)